MSGLFGQGEGRSERQGRGTGISILDMEALPPALRKIMRLLLRETEMTHGELYEAVAGMPEADRLSQAELDTVLATLSQQQWLLRVDDTYRVNHRRKARSTLREDIWDALDPALKPSKRSE